MLYRKTKEELLLRLKREERKPIVLRGARQVGKTTLVRMIASQFEQFIELNLEKSEDKKIFEITSDFKELVKAIFFYKGKSLKKETLIFIDEIQNSPEAIKQLRFFYEEGKNLYVVSAGSLLETLVKKNISFPVGRVEYLYVYPLGFYEFLKAKYPETIDFYEKVPIDEVTHEKFLKVFNEYALIGGMPEVVKNYIENEDLTEINHIYDSLITGFKDDIEKYENSKRRISLLRFVIDNAFREAGGRIKFSKFGGSNYKSVEMSETFRILEKAFLLKLVYPVTDTELPTIGNYKKSPKLMLLDNGLVNFVSNYHQLFFEKKNILEINSGKLAEQIVFQELRLILKREYSDIFFWVREKKQSTAEVDFVLPYKGLLIPIEVKGGKTGRLRSLHQFIDLAVHNFAVRVYTGKLNVRKTRTIKGKEFYLLNLPIYLLPKIKEYLDSSFFK